MKKRKSSRRGASKPGFYLFPGDLERDTRQLDDAAMGFWIRLLLIMDRQTPRGVVPGNLLCLAKLFGVDSLEVAQAWARTKGGVVDRLEKAGVFSRGKDVLPAGALADDAIVNRRMYREWLKLEDLGAKRSAAARARWANAGDAKRMQKGIQNGCKTHAKPMHAGDAQRMQNGVGSTRAMSGGYGCAADASSIHSDDANGMPSLPDHNIFISKSNDLEHKGDSQDLHTTKRGGKPLAVGGSLAKTQALIYAAELERLTGDGAYKMPGWIAKLEDISRDPERRSWMAVLFDRLEKDVDPTIAAARGKRPIEDARLFAGAAVRDIHAGKGVC